MGFSLKMMMMKGFVLGGAIDSFIPTGEKTHSDQLFGVRETAASGKRVRSQRKPAFRSVRLLPVASLYSGL